MTQDGISLEEKTRRNELNRWLFKALESTVVHKQHKKGLKKTGATFTSGVH
jgi:hypothetical protein